MNASSQTSAGALPPESPHGPAADAAFAAYGAVFPVPLGTATAVQRPAATASPDVPDRLVVAGPEPVMPQCYACQGPGPWVPCPRGRVYPSGAQVLYCRTCVPDSPTVEAAAGVIGPVMEKAGATPRQVARVVEEAGLLLDPEGAKAIADTAYQLGVTDTKAKFTEPSQEQDVETLDWFHTRWLAGGRLCDGLDLDDMLKVGDVLTALDGRAPTVLPLTIRWDGTVAGPAGDGPGETTLVRGATARGSNAVLVLDDDARLQLGERLLALHTAETCYTPGCGITDDDLDTSDPTVSGWILVKVAGLAGPARWWCNPWCASAAVTAGGAELAAADQLAAADPDAQAPEPPCGGDPLAYGPTGIRCGCGKDAHSNLVPCQPDELTVVDDLATVDGGL